MTQKKFIKYAISTCEKEIEEDINSCSIDGRFDRLRGLKHGLIIAETITEENFSENAMLNYIRRMIENY